MSRLKAWNGGSSIGETTKTAFLSLNTLHLRTPQNKKA